MKKIIILLTVLVLSTSCAQSLSKIKGNGNIVNKTRNVGEYNQISVAGSFHVTLVAGNEGKLEIKIADNLLEYLITDVIDGKLNIKWEKGINVNTREGVFITIPFTDLDAVTLSGSGDIISKNTLETAVFYTGVSGSGNITLTVEATKITSRVTGSGDITLKGNTKQLETGVTGSGDYHGYNLNADYVVAKVTGSGDINVIALKEINAKITGSGDIKYKGNPELQDTKVTGSGNITTF
ncbi:MAG: DUF2807 domain-containing protein [Flavobacteriaceae bacterium]|nr:DUF2807 domain-containing protein [Flavobacteriaceae bacterium]